MAARVELIFSQLDLDQSGRVSKEEWRVASLAQRHEVVSTVLRPLFEHLDLDGSGKLEASDLHAALAALLEGVGAAKVSRSVSGKSVDDVVALLKEHDLNKDDSIDFDEFCTMMMGSFESSVKRKALRSWDVQTRDRQQDGGGCALL